MNSRAVGRNIRRLRENAGYTQIQLADFMGVGLDLVRGMERGERSLTSEQLERVATLFGVTVEQMEEEDLAAPRCFCALRGRDLTVEEMAAISAINRIALNASSLNVLLGSEQGSLVLGGKALAAVRLQDFPFPRMTVPKPFPVDTFPVV